MRPAAASIAAPTGLAAVLRASNGTTVAGFASAFASSTRLAAIMPSTAAFSFSGTGSSSSGFSAACACGLRLDEHGDARDQIVVGLHRLLDHGHLVGVELAVGEPHQHFVGKGFVRSCPCPFDDGRTFRRR